MERKEIKVEVTYTEGYEKRFTEACLKQISKRSEETPNLMDNQKQQTA